MNDTPGSLGSNRDLVVSSDEKKYGAPFTVHSSNASTADVQPEYDVCVIGGGIHGVGVAQAAAAAGFRVMLIEKSRLAEGTSSRSSKLIHGGLRYLERFEISLVWESLREREILLRIAPDLVKRQKFFIPVFDRTSRKPWMMKLGLLMYAILAGGRKNTWFKTIPKSQWEALDGLDTNHLRRVLQYWDGQTDDAALTRAVMQSAQDLGADLFYPAEFESAKIADDGVDFRFRFGGQLKTTRACVVVNAAGPWADTVLGNVTPAIAPVAIDKVQGTHLEFPGRIEHGCYYVEANDQRVVFVMPWKGRTLVGTTESAYSGNPGYTTPTEDEVEYLKTVYARHFPDRDQTVINQWSGLRVLPAASGSAFKRSRETMLPVDSSSRPRFLSIYGGKLTGYRATALKVMKTLKKTLPHRTVVADTAKLMLRDPYQAGHSDDQQSDPPTPNGTT